MKGSAYQRLALNFNRLMGILDGSFGRSSRGAPGAGVLRAFARLQKHRAEQRERLKDAPPAVVTRQQLRSYAIRGR